MILMTPEIRRQAELQFPLGSNMEQLVVAKFFNPTGHGTWYLMNSDPDDQDYCWGIAKVHAIEAGSFSLSELTEYRGFAGLGIERDLDFKPRSAASIWEDLQAGKHV